MVVIGYRSALISFRQINIHLANGTESTNHCKSEKATRVCVCGWSWCMPANRGQGPGLIGLLMACCKALLLFSLYTDIPHDFMCLVKTSNAITIRNITNMSIQIYQNIKHMPRKPIMFQLHVRVWECAVPKPGYFFQKLLLSISSFLYALRSLYLCFFLFGGGI